MIINNNKSMAGKMAQGEGCLLELDPQNPYGGRTILSSTSVLLPLQVAHYKQTNKQINFLMLFL